MFSPAPILAGTARACMRAMHCWKKYRKVGEHMGKSGHMVNTCVRATLVRLRAQAQVNTKSKHR